MSAPHQTYYLACIGQWRCAFGGHVHDFGELRAAIGFFNALGLLWIALLPGTRLNTSVSRKSPMVFIHTTRVSWLGFPLIWSREELALNDDGQSLELTSTVRSMPLPLAQNAGGPGRIADDALSATYEIEIYGARMRQNTQRSDDQVILEQTLPGYGAKHPLQRVVVPS